MDGDFRRGAGQQICREVREIAHEADPELIETIKRRVQPYFVLEGNVAALQRFQVDDKWLNTVLPPILAEKSAGSS